MKEISPVLMDEVLSLMLSDSIFFTEVAPHLSGTLFPNQYYKEVYAFVKGYYTKHNTVPTYGIVSNELQNKDPAISALVEKVQKVNVADRKAYVVKELERYIKRFKMRQMIVRAAKSTEGAGTSEDQAIDEWLSELEVLEKFSLSKLEVSSIVKEFDKRYEDRQREQDAKKESGKGYKIPLGIVPLDYIMGGVERSESFIWLAPTNVGKSVAKRYDGVEALLQGFNVFHAQTDAKPRSAEDVYDSIITGVFRDKMKKNDLTDQELEFIQRTFSNLKVLGGDIIVKNYPIIDQPNMSDIESDFVRSRGEIEGDFDLIILDYLDEIHPKNGKQTDFSTQQVRARMRQTAGEMAGLGGKYNVGIITSKQCNTIPRKDLNDPNFWIDIENSGEAKHVFQPFDFACSINRTEEEKRAGIVRGYAFKTRELDNSEVTVDNMKFRFPSNYANGRFFDKKRWEEEKNMYWNQSINKPILLG